MLYVRMRSGFWGESSGGITGFLEQVKAVQSITLLRCDFGRTFTVNVSPLGKLNSWPKGRCLQVLWLTAGKYASSMCVYESIFVVCQSVTKQKP